MEPLYFVLDSFFWGYIVTFVGIVIVRRSQSLILQPYTLMAANNYLLLMRPVLSLIAAAILIAEFILNWYSGAEYEQYAFLNRWSGPYAAFSWIPLLLIQLPPIMMFRKRNRESFKRSFLIVILWSFSFLITRILEFLIESPVRMIFEKDYLLLLSQIVVYILVLIPAYWAYMHKPLKPI